MQALPPNPQFHASFKNASDISMQVTCSSLKLMSSDLPTLAMSLVGGLADLVLAKHVDFILGAVIFD